MIYQVSIGSIQALLDDELTEERPTPERAADYLTRCASISFSMWEALPDTPVECATDAEDD